MLDSRRYLGELPTRFLELIPKGYEAFPSSAAEAANEYFADALFLRVRDNPLAEMNANVPQFAPDELRCFVELLKRMLAYEPRERISAVEALRHDFFMV